MHNVEDMKRNGDAPALKRDVWASKAALRADFTSALNGLRSDLVGKIDGFMTVVMKVDRAQMVVDDRLSSLEGRA